MIIRESFLLFFYRMTKEPNPGWASLIIARRVLSRIEIKDAIAIGLIRGGPPIISENSSRPPFFDLADNGSIKGYWLTNFGQQVADFGRRIHEDYYGFLSPAHLLHIDAAQRFVDRGGQ